MLLDDVGVCDLSLDAFVIPNVANADGIPLKMKKKVYEEEYSHYSI